MGAYSKTKEWLKGTHRIADRLRIQNAGEKPKESKSKDGLVKFLPCRTKHVEEP